MHEASGVNPAQPPTLLIVADEPASLRAMRSTFAADYRVSGATGGVDALKIARDRRPDLILLDLTMSHPDGHEVCREMKMDRRTRAIPIIFVAKQSLPTQEALSLQSGAADFIARCADPTVMRARVRMHLESSLASRQLAALNESLETHIAELTCQRDAALRAAGAADRTKRQFLANLSHEILTPINGVIGMTYLALRADPALAQRDYLHKIGAAGQQLLDMIEDLLDFSRLAANEVILENIEFELSDVIRGVASQTRAAALAKGLELSFEFDRTLAGLYLGDPLRIGQVLIHYIANATKFSSSGSIRVVVARLSRGDAFDDVRMAVSDQGIGLHEREIGGLFQAFHQVDASFARQFGGNGLGLATCKEVAKLMGGDVGVDSVHGVGSTFWLTAKLHRVAPPSPGRAADEAALEGPDPLCGARILVAEDNLINRKLTVGLLEAVGITVDVVEDGLQASQQARSGAYDCILMDVQMPFMDGLEATRRIRADPNGQTVPILALTANARDDDRARCTECGMDDVIAKPVSPDSLYAALRRWLPAANARLAHATANARSFPTLGFGVGNAVDLRVLEKGVGGEPARFQRFAKMFIESVSGTLAELDRALVDEDLGKLAALGHRLKSSSSKVGALGFEAICRRLEQLRDDTTLLQARNVMDQMPALLAMVTAELAKGLE